MCLSPSPFVGCRRSLYKEGTWLFKLLCNILFTGCDLTLPVPFQSGGGSSSSPPPLWLSISTLFRSPDFAGGVVGLLWVTLRPPPPPAKLSKTNTCIQEASDKVRGLPSHPAPGRHRSFHRGPPRVHLIVHPILSGFFCWTPVLPLHAAGPRARLSQGSCPCFPTLRRENPSDLFTSILKEI